jgi:predicted nucleotidyltransferase
MIVRDRIDIPEAELAELARRYYVRELSLFGSVLRDDFRDDSDIDILVEFEPDAPVDLLDYIHFMNELTKLLGRKVDLVEKPGLRPFLRDEVLRSAQVIYVAA